MLNRLRQTVKKVLGVLFSRPVLTCVLILTQAVWLFIAARHLAEYSILLKSAGVVMSVLMCLAIIRTDSTAPEFKIGWIILFVLMPPQGGLLYLLWGDHRPAMGLRRKLDRAEQRVAPLRDAAPGPQRRLEESDPRAGATARYLRDYGPCPVYANTDVTYYPCGEKMLPDVLEALESAERYIFIETFILAPGVMWDAIHDVLRRKAAAGVEVRLIYDDAGSLTVLPHDTWYKLESEGIHAVPFNPFLPWVNLVMNNRDHRKIIVVDGRTAFTGGVNIADEYINRKERFGYWKDTGVRLRGDAAWSFTVMFLQFWEANRPGGGLEQFRPAPGGVPCGGLVQPYCDSPVDHETVAENLYLDLVAQARHRLWITTPYLILDNDMLTALSLAAKRGVDVRIYVPAIPDKKMIYQLTRSYFPPLIRAGVKVFTFTPGFLHAKTWLVDDRIGVVGSVNLDYRSLYLHFECGAVLYGCAALEEIRKDFVDTERVSAPVALSDCRTGFVGGLISAILRLVAPLC